eukprot:11099588-Heterocapsa_arctica.AAC.1
MIESRVRKLPLVASPEKRPVLQQRVPEQAADLNLLEHGHEPAPLRAVQSARAVDVVEGERGSHHLLGQEAVGSARHL